MEHRGRNVAILNDAMWLVSAMTLSESADEADRQVSSVPTTQESECQTCGLATGLRFKIQ
ncbi:hypothetical protein EXE52_17005 [Halorubrum sp. CGM4_25_10-8A]|nr:hypothetical protein EXE52_17005 [Halorubrum sp. CGM4_25_10-8A]